MTTATRWEFQGDVNLEYGGSFIDLSTFDDGYCSAVRVTDLDSGCGFDGAVMIEHVVINGTTDSKRIRDALRSFGGLGWANDLRGAVEPSARKAAMRHCIAEALMSYGYTDPDDHWDGQEHHTEIIQTQEDGPMSFDGWKADYRITNTTLEAYVESVHLS